MLIFPAIDVKDGRVVRLYQGDFASVHQVAEDPAATARTFCAAGTSTWWTWTGPGRGCEKTPPLSAPWRSRA